MMIWKTKNKEIDKMTGLNEQIETTENLLTTLEAKQADVPTKMTLLARQSLLVKGQDNKKW
jgi:hypothetical protein